MPSDPIWRGIARKGKVFLKNTVQYAMYVRCFPDDTNIELIVRKERKGNSRKQQNYYRGVMLPHLSNMLGVSTELAHGMMQRQFFTYMTEDGIEYIRSTKLNYWKTHEWEEKMTAIREWAFDFHDYIIPKPNEVEF